MPETVLKKLQAWLSTYPCWEDCPAEFYLLPKTMEETSRQADVLGNTSVGYRCYVNLFWEMAALGSETENAERMLKFLQWIQFQSASGFAPQLGDVPAKEKLRTEKSGLSAGTQTVAYTVTLVADFMKVYEVN